MDNRPIGVFDSGLGGLTAVKALRRLLPGEDLIYFGDTARVPYGGRSRETLLKYARQDIAFLRSFDLKAVLIACGTVTSTSLDTLRKENDLPVLGVVEPSCREALAVTKNKKIGMIATLASARSGAYERTLKGLDADVQVVSQPCPLFVPLVENGRFRQGDVVIETVAREYLTPLIEAGVDTLILGCTHYPLLKDIIGEICGPGVTLIDSGAASARALRQQLAAEGQLTDRQQGETRFYVSDRPEDFEKLAAVFLEEPLSRGAEQEKLPVMISVRGEQYFDDVDPNATELMTEGTLEQTEDGFLLSYQETELTGMEGTLTTFEIGPGRVILRRSGSVNSQMVFEEGRQHTSLYETPYGELSVDIQTSRLLHNLTERGGLMEIKYSIAVEHVVTGRNCFKIRVRRK